MYKTALNTINKYNMLQKGDIILVGASGGADSTALLYFLSSLKENLSLNLSAVYVNHGIRGAEAEEDGLFVKNLCEKLGIAFFYESVNVPLFSKEHKITEEEAGRILRYSIFNKILSLKNGGKIALGHNLNDNAETVIMRLARGTGSKGLQGIPPVRENIIRPLIECERSLIENYCLNNNLCFRTDSTNLSDIYSRNKVRLNIIPELLKLNPSALENILNTSVLLKEENSFIEKETEKAYTSCVLRLGCGVILLDEEKLKSLDKIILKNVLRKSIFHTGKSLKDISSKHIDMLCGLISKNTGKKVNLPGLISAEKKYGSIEIKAHLSEEKNKISFSFPLEKDSSFYIEEINKKITLQLKNKNFDKNIDNLCTKTFNYDKITGRLEIRTRKPGDFIRINGAEKGKSLKTFFIDNKIPKDIRDSIPLIACGSDILWICGFRVSDFYKSDDSTLNTLFITLEDDS